MQDLKEGCNSSSMCDQDDTNTDTTDTTDTTLIDTICYQVKDDNIINGCIETIFGCAIFSLLVIAICCACLMCCGKGDSSSSSSSGSGSGGQSQYLVIKIG